MPAWARRSRPDRVRAPSKDAVKHQRSAPRISSAIAGWLLVKTRLGSLPGEGNLPIETVTALNAKTAVQGSDVPYIYRGGVEAKVRAADFGQRPLSSTRDAQPMISQPGKLSVLPGRVDPVGITPIVCAEPLWLWLPPTAALNLLFQTLSPHFPRP